MVSNSVGRRIVCIVSTFFVLAACTKTEDPDMPTPGYETPTGGDDDVSAAGDDDASAGDDDASAGDDDTTSGDDGTSGDDDASAGDDDVTSGDDDASAGDDDGTSGDDDALAGDDDSISPTQATPSPTPWSSSTSTPTTPTPAVSPAVTPPPNTTPTPLPDLTPTPRPDLTPTPAPVPTPTPVPGPTPPPPVDLDQDGYTAAVDCDESDPSIHPGAQEMCDGIDNNCDGKVDEGVLTTWYRDGDGDGYGDEVYGEKACEAPGPDYIRKGLDCDDTDPQVNPQMLETCEGGPDLQGIDNNCDGQIDEGFDQDGDGYLSSQFCPLGTDCDDTEDAVHPGVEEICDTIDNNCDGAIDEGVSSIWYLDYDQDWYGNDARAVAACGQPTSDYVSVGGDCDDADDAVHPGAEELCDLEDNDCNGLVDEAFDLDGDGFSSHELCDFGTDCDDSDPSIMPDAEEICDEQDNNCDGQIDEGFEKTWYTDRDGDGYGNPASSVESCTQPSRHVADNTDCDDFHADVYPGAEEVNDGLDNDCDGIVDATYCFPATYNQHDYLFCNDETDWYSARFVCLLQGMDLVTIGDRVENAWIDATFLSLWGDVPSIWMGFTDQYVEGVWVWVTWESVDYTNWYPGEPDDGGSGEDCGALRSDTTWNDMDCMSESKRFVCEEKPEESRVGYGREG